MSLFQKNVIDANFGRQGFVSIVHQVQSTLNDQCFKLLDSFVHEWQVELHMNNVLKYSKQMASRSQSFKSLTSMPTEYKDPREYSPMLDQIVVVSQSLEVNLRFVRHICLSHVRGSSLRFRVVNGADGVVVCR